MNGGGVLGLIVLLLLEEKRKIHFDELQPEHLEICSDELEEKRKIHFDELQPDDLEIYSGELEEKRKIQFVIGNFFFGSIYNFFLPCLISIMSNISLPDT